MVYESFFGPYSHEIQLLKRGGLKLFLQRLVHYGSYSSSEVSSSAIDSGTTEIAVLTVHVSLHQFVLLWLARITRLLLQTTAFSLALSAAAASLVAPTSAIDSSQVIDTHSDKAFPTQRSVHFLHIIGLVTSMEQHFSSFRSDCNQFSASFLSNSSGLYILIQILITCFSFTPHRLSLHSFFIFDHHVCFSRWIYPYHLVGLFWPRRSLRCLPGSPADTICVCIFVSTYASRLAFDTS
ncbi:unnamed protein product [Protopolystoma xenopodis]|uniref:Uncharacterized protein n=1 Tax=Protopolystoma xenopodis TaxID=117903 RepID=A0A3S5FH75_9PLAT|nr:unnamed protein product [Protopolystoma xenopodis]